MTDFTSNTPLKIKGKNFDDCKRKLIDKYGTNFTITDNRQVLDSWFFGIIRKEYYEVTYLPRPRAVETHVPKKDDEDFEKKKIEILKSVTDATYTKQVASVNSKLDDILKQFKNISTSQSVKPDSIQKIERLLFNNEFTPSYVDKITERIKNEFYMNQLDNFEAIESRVVDWIGESIEITKPKVFRPPHVIVLVGPTGVGKTTTIAKFAARQMVEAKKDNAMSPKLCIVTIDTNRVGAVEQLSRFGAIMNVDVKKAETAEDVQTIYEENKDIVDTIYIDTAGYGPNDSENIGKMKAILDVPALNPDVYLVMSASTKASDMDEVMQNYEPFRYRSVIVTKCDETKKYGNIISSLSEKRKSISYICDGQNAARDLEAANIINFLIRLDGFDVNRTHIEEQFGEK